MFDLRTCGVSDGCAALRSVWFKYKIVVLKYSFVKIVGALVDLISLPVTVGFTSATAVIIGTSQLKVNISCF